MLKKFAFLIAGATAIATLSLGAHADPNYPNKPLRFHVSFPPGGSTDIAARIIAPALSERLGQPVIVDNRAGAGGVIGADAIAKSAPDGYTLGFGTVGSLGNNVTLMPKLPYAPLKDFAPISMAFNNPMVLVVNPALGVNSLKEFIALAKTKRINFGTPGNGSTMHLAGMLLNRMAGTEIVHAPYKGAGPAAVDLLAGHIEAVIVDLATARTYTESGRLKALAVTSAKRSVVAPDIPTFAEEGVPGYELYSWVAIVMPAGTPAAIVERVNKEVVGLLNDPKVNEQLRNAKVEPESSTPQQLRAIIERDIKDMGDLIKAANISL